MTKETWVIGFALFAMFFGAGNLIFPPYLGMESGTLWPLGLAFFVLIDVVMACLGIYALNAAGGGEIAFRRTIGKIPANILNTAAIVCTGVLIAMPRTAATTYEMTIVPSFDATIPLFPFSIAFFALVLLLTITESRVVDIIGKVLTPLLVVGIGALIICGIVNPLGPVGSPLTDAVVQDGINAGYQAMDIICVIGYSIVLQNALKERGFKMRDQQLKILTFASIIAAAMLALIYGGLTYLGATSGQFGAHLDQAALIVAITEHLMGHAGVIILGVVVFLACLTTAIGLISATAEYFRQLTHDRLSYHFGVIFCIVAGLLICNLQLENIIRWATPVLTMVCPPFMTTIVLILFARHIPSKRVYQGAALGAFLASIPLALHDAFGICAFVEIMPLFTYGFAWLPFAVLGGIIGSLAGRAEAART